MYSIGYSYCNGFVLLFDGIFLCYLSMMLSRRMLLPTYVFYSYWYVINMLPTTSLSIINGSTMLFRYSLFIICCRGALRNVLMPSVFDDIPTVALYLRDWRPDRAINILWLVIIPIVLRAIFTHCYDVDDDRFILTCPIYSVVAVKNEHALPHCCSLCCVAPSVLRVVILFPVLKWKLFAWQPWQLLFLLRLTAALCDLHSLFRRWFYLKILFCSKKKEQWVLNRFVNSLTFDQPDGMFVVVSWTCTRVLFRYSLLSDIERVALNILMPMATILFILLLKAWHFARRNITWIIGGAWCVLAFEACNVVVGIISWKIILM